MANITISNLEPAELEYTELSDLELEAVVGGKEAEPYLEVGYSQEKGFNATVGIKF